MHVLILGARAPVCLEWARAFHASGWSVTAADSVIWPIARASRAVDDYFQLPEPRTNTSAWIETLCRLVDERAIDLVLPTCEEAFYLAAGIEKLSIRCKVMTTDFTIMHHLHHKYIFAKMTEGWPIEAPETLLLENVEAVNQLSARSEMLVFKPVYSRFANRTLIQPSPEKLKEIQPTPQQPWVAQKFIAGREHCSYSLLVEGRLTAHACYHPRYRVGRGAGIYFEPTTLPMIRAFVERFGATTGYTGQVGFDFIEAYDGQCYVLECNPRGTSGVHLFDDQPQALVAALLGKYGQDVLLPTDFPRMVSLAMLLFAAPRYALDTVFWHNYFMARDVVTRHGDHRPLPVQLLSLLEIIYRALARKLGLLAASTADIEWDGQPMNLDVKNLDET